MTHRRRPAHSKGKRALLHSAWCSAIYIGSYWIVLRHLPQWLNLALVCNMMFGSTIMDRLFRRSGSATIYEAYTLRGCLRFLAISFAWPITAPMLHHRLNEYERQKRESACSPADQNPAGE